MKITFMGTVVLAEWSTQASPSGMSPNCSLKSGFTQAMPFLPATTSSDTFLVLSLRFLLIVECLEFDFFGHEHRDEGYGG